jgi:hypothetical protein
MTFFCFSFFALAQTVAPVQEPQNLDQALGFLPTVLSFFKNGQWLLLGASLTLVLVFAIKKYLLAKWNVPSGVVPFISAGLGIAVGVAGAVLGGASPQAALLAVLSGPLASAMWSSGVKYLFPQGPKAP